jgi:hypothetical protein
MIVKIYDSYFAMVLLGSESQDGNIFSKKIVYSKPNNYGLKNYCVTLSGPPLGLNDYSLAPPTRRSQTKTEQPVLTTS